jgi:lambda repressor-like predicted transcriptional regulator
MTLSIERLRQDWDEMHPLDRAKTIAAIRRSGTSIRQIARQTGHSATLLRHLLMAQLAPKADIELARNGKASINELVRKAKAEKRELEVSIQEIEKEKRAKQALKAASLICKWLAQTGLNGPSCETIINNVRRELAEREQKQALPAQPNKIKLPINEIMQRMKPPELSPDDGIALDGWYQVWLCRWVFWAYPDSGIRSAALDIALERQWKR